MHLRATPARRRRWRGGGAAAVLTVLVTAGACAEPSGSYADYVDKVQQTAQQMMSVIGTAQIAATAALHHRATAPYVDTVVTTAESAAKLGAGSARQPAAAGRPLQLMQAVDQPLQKANDLIRRLRIAVRSGDAAEVARADLGLSGPLHAFEKLKQVR